MIDLLDLAVGFLAGACFTWVLWRTIFLPRAVWQMREFGLITYNDDVINAYRSDH